MGASSSRYAAPRIWVGIPWVVVITAFELKLEDAMKGQIISCADSDGCRKVLLLVYSSKTSTIDTCAATTVLTEPMLATAPFVCSDVRSEVNYVALKSLVASRLVARLATNPQIPERRVHIVGFRHFLQKRGLLSLDFWLSNPIAAQKRVRGNPTPSIEANELGSC